MTQEIERKLDKLIDHRVMYLGRTLEVRAWHKTGEYFYLTGSANPLILHESKLERELPHILKLQYLSKIRPMQHLPNQATTAPIAKLDHTSLQTLEEKLLSVIDLVTADENNIKKADSITKTANAVISLNKLKLDILVKTGAI